MRAADAKSIAIVDAGPRGPGPCAEDVLVPAGAQALTRGPVVSEREGH